MFAVPIHLVWSAPASVPAEASVPAHQPLLEAELRALRGPVRHVTLTTTRPGQITAVVFVTGTSPTIADGTQRRVDELIARPAFRGWERAQ